MTMRTLVLVVLFALVAAAALPALDAQGNRPADRGRDMASARAAHAQEAQEWQNLTPDERARGLARAAEARMFGQLNLTGGAGEGRFVSFELSGANVTDHGIRSNGTTNVFLASVDVEGFAANGTPAVTGSVLRLVGDDAALAIHDNPTGMLHYHVENATLTLTFTLAPGVNMTVESERSLMLVAGAMHGHLVLHGNATYTNASGVVTVTAGPDGGAMFMAHPMGSVIGSNLHAVRDAIASDRVGGMLSVVKEGARPIQERTFLGVSMRATRVEANSTDVVVSSEDPTPRAVVLHLAPGVLNVTTGANVTVLIDGERVSAAGSAAAALNASGAAFHASPNATGLQVIVAVPGFSEHTITVATETTGTTPPVTTTPAATPDGTTTTTPAGTTPPATTSPAATSPATTPEGDADTPAPALALVLAALGVVALAARRR